MHRTGELYGHFQTMEQQKDAASMGMWVFLASEILFFGGVFAFALRNLRLRRWVGRIERRQRRFVSSKDGC